MRRIRSSTAVVSLLLLLSSFSHAAPPLLAMSADDPPTVALLPPVEANQRFTCPPVVAMHWTWPETAVVRPDSSRYVLISSKVDLGDPDLYVSFPESLFTLPQRYHWSPWRTWDAPDGSGVRAVLSGLSRVGDFPGSGYYIFAVQVMDENGNVTPGFDFRTPERNNVALLRVSGSVGPILALSETNLGLGNFVGTTATVPMTSAVGQTLQFQWAADASAYGGVPQAYRYGWDLPSPDLEEGWEAWGPGQAAAPRSFAGGTHTLHVEARDDLGLVARAGLFIEVVPINMSRDLLWVDDTDHLSDTATEAEEDARWLQVLQQVALVNDLNFDPILDVYDVVQNGYHPPSSDLLFDRKVVVWSTRSGADGTSALRQTAQFFDPFPMRNWNTTKGFNDLGVYVANGGRLWINGFRPEKQLWPDERERGREGEPVNVTCWDDPIEPHAPGIDSVGTISLLYRMSVEMFDVGSSLDSPRNQSDQYCLGFRAAAPDVPELHVDATAWGQAGRAGRSNISIYNMPAALAAQIPPLLPPSGRVRVLYTYRSGLAEDPSRGFVYPQTADNQPAFILGKTSSEASHYGTAICGFEPYLLTESSHLQLLTHLLVDEMGLGPTPVLLARFSAHPSSGAVHLNWQLQESGAPTAFRLQAHADGGEWDVPYRVVDAHTYTATDESPALVPGGTVVYSLFLREGASGWMLLAKQTVQIPMPSRSLQLLSPRPNPFNPSTEISWVLPERQRLRLRIFGLDGRSVATLVDAVRPAGPGRVIWDGTDGHGRPLASGIYVVRLEARGRTLSRKLVLLK